MHHLHTLDLNLLRVLDALLATRSVSVAAKELGLSQPATSHALARLREALGDPLLVRMGAAMVPTPRAEAIGPPLRRLLGELERVLAESGGFDPATSRRRFVLACPDMLAPLLPELLGALADAPGVDLELTGQAAEADLALDAFPTDGPAIIVRSLGRVHQCVAMRPEHPSIESDWTVETWLRWPHVVVRTPVPGPGFVERALATAGLSRRVGLYAPSFLMATQVIARTDLFFTAPRELLRLLPAPLELRPVPLPMPPVPVAAFWPERMSADAGHRWFREKVIDVASRALGVAGEHPVR